MFRKNYNLNQFLKLKIKLLGRILLITFYIFIAFFKELYALPMLDGGVRHNCNILLSETFNDHNTANRYCHSMYNGRLYDIERISDLHQIQKLLANKHKTLSVHVGNVRLKLGQTTKFPTLKEKILTGCWAATITPSGTSPVLNQVDCNLNLPSICKVGKQKSRRAITYSYLYVNENWQDNLQRLIYGSDGRCSSRTDRIVAPESRVVGGGSATYGSQPWQVEIAVMKHNSYRHHCSGVILTPVFILTAAHCFEKDRPLKLFRVTTGDYEIGAEDEHEDHYEIERLAIHPNHRANGFDNDIAIIKLKSKNNEGIHFGSHVLPACIPNSYTPHTPGTSCVVSGWGIRETEANSQLNTSAVLQSAQVELLSTTTCREVYRNYSSVSKGMICAGHWDGRIDSCRGDSGGPLVCDINGQNLVFGLVSWGQDCGQPNRPGVYVHLQHYLKWIHQMVEELS